jgi:peptidoglycan hydrolase-like protein with peptidoglycan-binding domain
MNKIIATSFAVFTLLGTSLVSAESYYPVSTQYGCVNLSSDLSYQSRGVEVMQLQTFLVSQNFPGGGGWMVTGYFGTATMQAVRNFQQREGLPVSGKVDAATRAAINRVSCGGSYGYTTPYTYPTTPYNYNYSYPTGGLMLNSLSVNTGGPGTLVTINGSGFDYANNTVYFGSTPLANIASYNGTSLTFSVPTYLTGISTGNVQVYVTNTRGTSNSLAFNVVAGGGVTCGVYPYASCGGCSYNYGYGYGYNNYNCQPPVNNIGMPVINYLNPASGGVNTAVSVVGSGFSMSGNTVHFGQGVITNLYSSDGRGLSFTVPAQLSGYGSQTTTLGTYNVSVSNSAGYTSNALPFTVTSLGQGSAPTVSSVNGPTSLSTGVSGLWTIQVTNPSNNYLTTTVTWGDESQYGYAAAAPQTSYVQGTQTLSFTHTYATSGSYTITFTVNNGVGSSNIATATVYVSGSGTSGSVTLSSLNPTYGHVGTQVIITGSGFNLYDNTVRFGVGGTQHVPSVNGTIICYTIPAFISACDTTTGYYCTMVAQQVTPGLYPISVTNTQGTSNTLSFLVQ